MSWLFEGQPFTEQQSEPYVGFVYCITEASTGKKYIGKKLFWTHVKRKVKGKAKRVKKASDWQSYYGSNVELKSRVEGEHDQYHREILYLCKTKGDCSYLELREQVIRNVLIDPMYYNAFVGGKIHAKHLSNNISSVISS